VPIVGKTPSACFTTFRDHLAGLLHATIPTKVPVLADANAEEAHVGFRQGEAPVAVPIDTNRGRLFFWVAQLVRADQLKDGSYKLSTLNYWYRLQASDGARSQALIRWEYDRTLRGGKNPCRHHVQQAATIDVPGQKDGLDLNKLHVPTGWVMIEEVLRFLIVDLGVRPPCGKNWPTVLDASATVFREKFSTPH
jgi:hypothetical protein